MSHDIDTVFLDVGGVLLLPNHDIVLDALAAAGVHLDADEAALDRAHYAGAAALTDFPAENVEVWNVYQRAYAVAAGVPDHLLDQACAALAAAFPRLDMFSRPAPGAHEALSDLAATGVALAIVSNAQGQVEGLLADAGLCQCGPGAGVTVAAVIDSHAVGVAKPDPRIFELAMAAVGTTADRAVHVGDVVGADVDGATAAGITPLHLDPHGLCADGGHAHVTSLAEVVDLLT
ncbi:MAG TPA: HAD family hydrolase [Acidimicrobiia bacterium]|nr:HAD family hydrolase [Acidimicrobiia bacterium]